MNRKIVWIGSVSLLLGFSSALAQDEGTDEEAETTIRLMGAAEAELPNAVTDPIALPGSVPVDAAAVEHAQTGINTANENRARRDAGLTKADEARDNGAEMADEALESQENRGRSDDLPTPDNVPDRPQPQPPTG